MFVMSCRLNQLTVAIGFCALLFLNGCGTSTPAEGDGQKAIEVALQSNGKCMVRLSSFKKTDGQLAELMGVKLYFMEWAGTIEATSADCMFDPNTFETAPMAEGLDLLLHITKASLRKGSAREIAGKISFEKSERGWRATKFETTKLAPDKEVAAKQKAAEDAAKAKKAESELAESGGNNRLTVAEVKQALADGVKPDSALFYAVSSGNIEVASYCIERGADPDNKGRSVPHILTARSPEMLELLRSKGANFNVNMNGMTYLHVQDKPELLEFVLSKKLVTYKKSDAGLTPLMHHRRNAEKLEKVISEPYPDEVRKQFQQQLEFANQAIALLMKAGFTE